MELYNSEGFDGFVCPLCWHKNSLSYGDKCYMHGERHGVQCVRTQPIPGTWLKEEERHECLTTDECHNYGIGHGCDDECPVFQRGECESGYEGEEKPDET